MANTNPKVIKTIEYQLKSIKTNIDSVIVNSSKVAYDFAQPLFGDSIGIYESFFVLFLNRNNRITGYAKLSQGGISATIVDIRLVAKYAIDTLCSGVILCHNHPSGSLIPSDSDKKLTKDITDILKICSVLMLDHIIIADDKYLSFADEGLIN